MVNVFIGRIELLPSGETIEQHTTWQREEADIVQQDKENQDPRSGGLFKGCFRAPRIPAPSIRALRDAEDGVDRCPLCQWELEDGECAQCGVFFDENGELTWGDSFTGFSDLDEMSERDEELDAELEMEDDFGGFDELSVLCFGEERIRQFPEPLFQQAGNAIDVVLEGFGVAEIYLRSVYGLVSGWSESKGRWSLRTVVEQTLHRLDLSGGTRNAVDALDFQTVQLNGLDTLNHDS